MTGCALARPEDRPALMRLWMRCFDEEPAALEYFFNHRFVPENCVLWRQEDTLAAALHLLPAVLREENALVPIHYLYAAGTLPEFRGRGIMRAMLEQVWAVIAPARKEHYSVLLPAGDSLYAFYRACGYRELYKTRFVTLTRLELEGLASAGTAGRLPLAGQAALRDRLLCSREGSVIWNAGDLAYAQHVNDLYGGFTIEAPGGYALCRPSGETLEVLELCCEREAFPHLLGLITEHSAAKDYRFRLSCSLPILEGQGTLRRFGMIRAVKGRPDRLLRADAPYLGLPLD